MKKSIGNTLVAVVAASAVATGCSAESTPAPTDAPNVQQIEDQLKAGYEHCSITSAENTGQTTKKLGYLTGMIELTLDAPRNSTQADNKSGVIYTNPVAILTHDHATQAPIYWGVEADKSDSRTKAQEYPNLSVLGGANLGGKEEIDIYTATYAPEIGKEHEGETALHYCGRIALTGNESEVTSVVIVDPRPDMPEVLLKDGRYGD